MSSKIRFVCATREAEGDFYRSTALGRSLAPFRDHFDNALIEVTLFANNSLGLPAVYNKALRDAARDPAILVFVHDDVYLCDFFWPQHLPAAFKHFDIVGVAGSTRRLPRQPAWCFVDDKFSPESIEHTSGVLSHGPGFPPLELSFLGPAGQAVKLLDGLFLAARSEVLLAHDVRFDERFDFHLYDVDFCRQAELRNLRMGTWWISVIHQSHGAFGTAAWRRNYERYLSKWGS